jgi:sulfite exporter TauE/SafE
MELWTGFLLGLVGSLHCAGMCGPLALALPRTGSNSVAFGFGRLCYNLGRISAYSLLGIIFGLIGQTVALAGFQRWASLVAGMAILLALVPASRRGFSLPVLNGVGFLKGGFASLLRQRTFPALYLLGLLNGFLPCGLVYVACAASVALGSVVSGVLYMVVFGLGTVPLMLGIGLIGGNLQVALRMRFQKLIPVCLAVVGLLLIIRGMALGIPYVSPNLSAARHFCH